MKSKETLSGAAADKFFEAERIEDFLKASSNLEGKVRGAIFPDKISSAFEIPDIDLTDVTHLPDELARYRDVDAPMSALVSIDTQKSSGYTSPITANILVEAGSNSTRVFAIHPDEDTGSLTMSVDNEPIDISTRDAEHVLVSLVLPSFAHQQLGAEDAYARSARVDITSQHMIPILLDSLHNRTDLASDTREYTIPETAESPRSTFISTTGMSSNRFIFQSSELYRKDDDTIEINYTTTDQYIPGSPTYEPIEVTANARRNSEEVAWPQESSDAVIELAINRMKTIARSLENN